MPLGRPGFRDLGANLRQLLVVIIRLLWRCFTAVRHQRSPDSRLVMADLTGVYAKIDRAYFHALDLTKKLGAALDPQTHRFVAERDGTLKLVYRIVELPEVKSEWSLILGDFLTNLRAALDYLACQLAQIEGPSTCENTSFPILDSSLNKKGNPRSLQINGVTNQDVINAVIAGQPYTAAEIHGHPLEETALHTLNTLVNHDKHRLLLVTMHALHTDTPWWEVPEGQQSPEVQLQLGALEDHSEVAWFDFGNSEPYPGFDPHLSLTVRLRDRVGLASLPLPELMRTLGGEVEHEIGMRFAPFFGRSFRHDALRSWRELAG